MNIFNGLLKFKNRVDDVLLTQSDTLSTMLSESAGQINAQFSGMIGKAYRVAGDSAKGWTITSFAANNGALSKIDDFTSNVWDDVQASPIYQNAIADNVRCADFNTALSSITTGFLTNVNMDVSQIISNLQNFVNTKQGEVQELINNLLQVADDGKISQQQWISILSSMLDGVNQGEEDGTFELDTTNPFTFQGVMGLVMQALSAALDAVFTAIFAAVGGIFAGIAFLAAKLVGLLFNNNVVSNELQLSNLAPNSYVKGPMCAFDSSTVSQKWVRFPQAKSPVKIVDLGVADYYFWTSTSGDLYVNSYLKCNYSLSKVLALIQNHLHEKTSPSNMSCTWKWLPFLGSEIVNCELDADEAVACQYDSALALDAITASALVTIMSSMNAVVENDADTVFGAVAHGAADDMETFLWHVFQKGSLNDFAKSIQLKFVSQYVKAGFQDRSVAHLAGSTFLYGQTKSYATSAETTISYFLPGLVAPFYPLFEQVQSGSPSTGFSYSVRFWNPSRDTVYYTDDAGDEISAPPSKWLITIPDFDVATVVAFLVVLSGVVAATVVAGLKLSKALKKRKLGKQVQAQSNLEALRNAYKENPSQENLNAYNKAIRKYNFKAKLFGWYTYDGQNQWFDEPGSSAGSSTDTSLGTDVAALPSITDILKAIKG